MDKNTKTGLYILGGAAVLAVAYYFVNSSSKSSPPANTPKTNTPKTTSSPQSPAQTAAQTVAKALTGGGGGASAGNGGANNPAVPKGPGSTPDTSGQTSYSDGSWVDSTGTYWDADDNIIGYLGVDGNLYDNNGLFIANAIPNADGSLNTTPEAQAIYDDGSYLDDLGFLHDNTGLETGLVDTNGTVWDITGTQVLGIEGDNGQPVYDGPPAEDPSNPGYDQYGNVWDTSNPNYNPDLSIPNDTSNNNTSNDNQSEQTCDPNDCSGACPDPDVCGGGGEPEDDFVAGRKRRVGIGEIMWLG